MKFEKLFSANASLQCDQLQLMKYSAMW